MALARTDLDLHTFLELQRRLIHEEKKRLGCFQDSAIQHSRDGDDQKEALHDRDTSTFYKKEEVDFRKDLIKTPEDDGQNFPLVERLDLSSCHGSKLEAGKQAFIDKLESSDNPLSFRLDDGCSSTRMLRYGEYSPNNPHLRVVAAPYLGLGEYEQRKQLILKQHQADYRQHIARKNQSVRDKVQNYLEVSGPVKRFNASDKAVQTDIKNIHSKLMQYDLYSQNPPEKELCPQPVNGKSIRTMQGSHSPLLNKPKGILSNKRDVSRETHRLYVPSILDAFSYQDKAEYVEQERLKREAYQAELRAQIEEKRRLNAMREEQDRRERDLENRKFEQQLLRLQEEQRREEQYQKNQMLRRTSEDLKSYREEQLERSFKKHTESESSMSSLRNTKVASHYSPPVSRRVPYSFNNPSTSVFATPSTNRYNTTPFYDNYKRDAFTRRAFFSRSESAHRDEPSRSRSNSFNRYETLNRHESLSRIDALQRQDSLSQIDSLSLKDSRTPRRHSATQQDVGLLRRSPKSQRSDRSISSRFDDTLPIPLLKHSPVARDLKHSVAVDSRQSSEALRKLEDRWQVPAVQKNILSHEREGQRNVLTQLGAIRMQLQKEQLHMDEAMSRHGVF